MSIPTRTSAERYVDFLASCWEHASRPREERAPTVVSLFAGCGGSSLGYKLAGYDEKLMVEWDKHAAACARRNFPDVPIYQGDVAKLSAARCCELADIGAGVLDVLDGSPPCQGFSTAGKGKFFDARNTLFEHYIRLLDALKPKCLIAENVSGMVAGSKTLLFAQYLHAMKACGYEVSVRLMDASYFQVPQARKRLIFIGTRIDLGIAPSHPRAVARPMAITEALQGVEPKRFRRLSGKTLSDWSRTRPGESMPSFKTRKKLDPQKPSNTQCAGNAHYHWDEAREMSLEEQAILQSFPPQFVFIGNHSSVQRQIGNSVPPLMMYHIARFVREAILDKRGQAIGQSEAA